MRNYMRTLRMALITCNGCSSSHSIASNSVEQENHRMLPQPRRDYFLDMVEPTALTKFAQDEMDRAIYEAQVYKVCNPSNMVKDPRTLAQFSPHSIEVRGGQGQSRQPHMTEFSETSYASPGGSWQLPWKCDASCTYMTHMHMPCRHCWAAAREYKVCTDARDGDMLAFMRASIDPCYFATYVRHTLTSVRCMAPSKPFKHFPLSLPPPKRKEDLRKKANQSVGRYRSLGEGGGSNARQAPPRSEPPPDHVLATVRDTVANKYILVRYQGERQATRKYRESRALVGTGWRPIMTTSRKTSRCNDKGEFRHMYCMIEDRDKDFYLLRFLDARIVSKEEAEQCAKDGTCGAESGSDDESDFQIDDILDVAIDPDILDATLYWVENNKERSIAQQYRRYKVRWADYGPEEDTWEPHSCFNDKSMLAEWEDKFPKMEFITQDVLSQLASNGHCGDVLLRSRPGPNGIAWYKGWIVSSPNGGFLFESDGDTGDAVCEITEWAFVRGFAQGKRRRELDEGRFRTFKNMVHGAFESATTAEMTKEETLANVRVGNAELWNEESSDEMDEHLERMVRERFLERSSPTGTLKLARRLRATRKRMK